jgi:hypothetical protein
MEDEFFIVLEIEGKGESVSFDPETSEIMLDGENVKCQIYSKDGVSYVKLADGRAFKDLSREYADVIG